MKRRGTVGGLLTTAALLLSTIVPLSGAGAASQVNYVVTADRLALAVTSAKSPAAVAKAITSLMRGVGVPIMDNKGRRSGSVAAGGPGLPLYAAEVSMLADSYKKGLSFTADQLAASITAAGLKQVAGRPWTSADVVSALHASGLAAAQAPTRRTSLLPLVARALGVHRHQRRSDPAKASAAALVLDPVQYELALLDIAAAVAQRAPVPRHLAVVKPTVEPFNLPECAQEGKAATGPQEIGTWIGKKIVGKAKSAGKGVLKVALSLAHASTVVPHLHYQWQLPDDPSTHYGHESPGAPLDYTLTITFDEHLTRHIITCGEVLWGLRFPEYGPVDKILVLFQKGALSDHGDVSCLPSSCRTGKDGKVTLHFQPKQEKSPYGQGAVRPATGTVIAAPATLYSLGNSIFAASDVGLLKGLPWTVTWHEALQVVYSISVHRQRSCSSGCDQVGQQHSLVPSWSEAFDYQGSAVVPLSTDASGDVSGSDPVQAPFASYTRQEQLVSWADVFCDASVYVDGNDSWSTTGTTPVPYRITELAPTWADDGSVTDVAMRSAMSAQGVNAAISASVDNEITSPPTCSGSETTPGRAGFGDEHRALQEANNLGISDGFGNLIDTVTGWTSTGATSGVLATKSLTTVVPVLPPATGQDTITESWRLEATSQ